MVAITWGGWAVCCLAVKFYLIPRSVLLEASEKLLFHFILTGVNWYSWEEFLPVLLPNIVFISLRWWVDNINKMLLCCFWWAIELPWLLQVWGFFVSEELTMRNNALHFSYILKIVKILQDCLFRFAIRIPWEHFSWRQVPVVTVLNIAISIQCPSMCL